MSTRGDDMSLTDYDLQLRDALKALGCDCDYAGTCTACTCWRMIQEERAIDVAADEAAGHEADDAAEVPHVV